jgi:hypothetical protein
VGDSVRVSLTRYLHYPIVSLDVIELDKLLSLNLNDVMRSVYSDHLLSSFYLSLFLSFFFFLSVHSFYLFISFYFIFVIHLSTKLHHFAVLFFSVPLFPTYLKGRGSTE